ncbi:hypothetical protein IQ241_14720 [Romeria aff. gracilis LEGE 07310]|uniref:Uncharacterized protein n=1 Tax=Vasconcelosia minhoensis LEGE 07310 TaxID=915328 RepID=A0A8J7DD98_9CYAN|nr:hypothetical protein [Romeria gracilis]MBE9078533.1 hypothetical protein [Romeria aff. gracilis LEGE 07310]
MPLKTTAQPQKQVHPKKLIASPPAEKSSQSVRFFKDGYWWEVEKKIQGKQATYFQCRPTCWNETRFYSAQEIMLAIQKQRNRAQAAQAADRRGSGRVSALNQASRPETCKLLLVGSKKAVQGAIVKLHTLGYASADGWSAIQPGRKPNEVVSILVHRLRIS